MTPLSLLFNIGIITGGTKRRNIKIFGASREALELWVAKADVVTGWSFDAQKLEKITSSARAQFAHHDHRIINSILQHMLLHVITS